MSMAGDVLRQIESLRFGDLIFLRWGDASLDISKLPGDHEVEAPVYAWGVFLGVRGRKRKHLLLGKSKPPLVEYWEADRIPVPLIDYVTVVIPGFLKRFLPHSLKVKKIRLTSSPEMWPMVKVRHRA